MLWRKPMFKRFHPILRPIGVGLIISLAAWFVVSTWDDQVAEQEFIAEAQAQKFVLENGFSRDLRELSALRALFESSERGVSRHQFLAFTGKIFPNDSPILGATWTPRVKREDRAAHEAEGARDGIPNYRIRAVASDNSLVTAAESEEYFPLFYLTDNSLPSTAFGIDQGSEPSRRAVVEFARDNDEISVSSTLVLHAGTGDRKGFIASLPVYRPDSPHSTIDERRENLIGLVQGAFQTSTAVEKILSKSLPKQATDVFLFGPESSVDGRPLYVHRSQPASSHDALMSQQALAAGPHWSADLPVGNKTWRFVAVPSSGALVTHNERAWLVLICGLLITGFPGSRGGEPTCK